MSRLRLKTFFSSFLIGFIAGLFFILIDLLMDTFILGEKSFIGVLLHPEPFELIFRIFLLVTAIVISVFITYLSRRKTEEETRGQLTSPILEIIFVSLIMISAMIILQVVLYGYIQEKNETINHTIIVFYSTLVAAVIAYVLLKSRQNLYKKLIQETEKRRKDEQILREEEEKSSQLVNRLNLILESTEEGIYGLDKEGKCTFFNKAASELTGYMPYEVIGKNLHGLIHHSHSDGSLYSAGECPITNTFKEGRRVEVNNEVFWNKNGKPFYVEYTAYPIFEKGVIKGTVVTFIKISPNEKESDMRLAG